MCYHDYVGTFLVLINMVNSSSILTNSSFAVPANSLRLLYSTVFHICNLKLVESSWHQNLPMLIFFLCVYRGSSSRHVKTIRKT